MMHLLNTYLHQQTPPRILTLDNHYFPAVDEEEVLPHVDEIVNPVNTRPRTYNTETQIVKHVRYKSLF